MAEAQSIHSEERIDFYLDFYSASFATRLASVYKRKKERKKERKKGLGRKSFSSALFGTVNLGNVIKLCFVPNSLTCLCALDMTPELLFFLGALYFAIVVYNSAMAYLQH